MKPCFKRQLSTSIRCCAPKAPFKTNAELGKPARFERNFPAYKRQKAWEREGMDKDTFFRKKYAHVHVKQMANRAVKRAEREAKMDSKDFERPEKYVKKMLTSPLYDYVYGTSPVLAALKANRRSYFGKLSVYNPKEKHNEIVELLNQRGGQLEIASSKGELFQLCQNRTHNGYVLMCNPLVTPSIKALGKCPEGEYTVVKKELGELVNDTLPVSRHGAQYPLGIYVDEISDPHNLGAIMRSAYFLGVDFVVLSEKNCAPLSPVVSKVSAGAMELMPIYRSPSPIDFFDETVANGWNIVSTVAPHHSNKRHGNMIDSVHLHKLLEQAPTLLVVGSEGEGIRTNLKSRSTHLVELQSPRSDLDESVDSLNASVAVGILLQKLVQA